MDIANNVMFTQMLAKARINKFRETAISAMFKEFNRLDKGAIPRNPGVIPIDTKILTAEENVRLYQH